MKRLLSVLLSLTLLLSVSAGAFAEAAETSVLQTQVLVIGGGGAGISAAIAAAEEGAEVLLIEKLGYLGGATIISGGKIPAANSKQQEEKGIEDSVEALARDILRPSNYSARQELVYTVAENATPVAEWLESMGVVWTLMDSLYYGQTEYRMLNAEGNGAGMTSKMIDHLNSLENVTVMLETTGTGLITNQANEVIGATAEGKDGEMVIYADNVVLATSGFAANKEMLEKYIPEIVDAYPMVAPGATGEGILWGMELGAAVENMHAYQGYGFYCEGVGAMDQGLADRGGIMVNLNTERFCDEHNGYSQIAPHVIAQPEHHVYLIFDEANAQQTDLSAYEEKGLLIKADTVAELAEKTGLDAEKLEKVVEEYREGIEKGEDKFNRTLLPESFEAPFYAIYMTADLRHTQGGLVTDVAAHVLTEDNEVIQGLYAAGGVTEGFSTRAGADYMSGNGLLQALVFGRIAGERAATETRGAQEYVPYTGTGLDNYKD